MTVEDKYNNVEHTIDFDPDSLIQWFPLNLNYNYYYSDKYSVYYLGMDSFKVTDFTKSTYGIDKKNLWTKGIGILSINDGDLFCPEVFLGNQALCNQFENMGITNLYHEPVKSEVEKSLKYVLAEITRQSIKISRRYEAENKTNPANLETYFETSLKIAKPSEDNYYNLLGSAYIMLLKMRDMAVK